jgi:hypothetical protein
MAAHASPVAPARKHVGPTHANRNRLRLLALDTEVRQEKGEEGDATLALVLKHLDATYV